MPPKPKITRDMVVDAAFEVARKTGAENINARTVSKKLNCSTQPVMYHFATIEALMLTSHVFPTQTKMRHQSPAMNDGANYLCTLKKRQNFGSGF